LLDVVSEQVEPFEMRELSDSGGSRVN